MATYNRRAQDAIRKRCKTAGKREVGNHLTKCNLSVQYISFDIGMITKTEYTTVAIRRYAIKVEIGPV
jgi:hypothetical protein